MANPSFNSLAVIAGCAVDWGLTKATSYGYAYTCLLLGIPLTLTVSLAVQLVFLTLGTLYTVFGGYTAGRFARANPLRHGVVVGLVAVAFGMLSQLTSAVPSLQLIHVAGIGLSLPAAILGALLSRGDD